MNHLPQKGFLRIKNLIGDRKANPPIPALLPVSRVTLWEWIRDGKFPRPTYPFSPNIPMWHVERVLPYLAPDEPKSTAPANRRTAKRTERAEGDGGTPRAPRRDDDDESTSSPRTSDAAARQKRNALPA